MSARPDLNAYPIRPLHAKAKVDLRQKNFTDKFEAALNEIAMARQKLQKLERHLEPHQIDPIDLNLNMARNHIEFIWRESGLKK